jgi:hypothetical protein
MHGHEQLIAMRRRGYVPLSVHIDADGVIPRRITSEWASPVPGLGVHALLCVEPGDSPRLLDLHFLVRLRVFVSGANRARVASIAQACADAGAAHVIANVAKACGLEEDVEFWEVPCERADFAA